MTSSTTPAPRPTRGGETVAVPADPDPVAHARDQLVGKRRVAASAGGAFFAALTCSLGVVQGIPTTYVATSVVSFSPRPTALTTADTIQLICQKYVVVARSDGIVHNAARMAGVTPEDLADSITVSVEAGTANVDITVERPDPRAAADAANAIARLLVRRTNTDALVQGETTAQAAPSRTTSKPARSLLTTAGVLAAALVGVLAATVLKGRLRPRVRRTRPPGVAVRASGQDRPTGSGAQAHGIRGRVPPMPRP